MSDWVIASVNEVASIKLGKMLDRLKNRGRPQPCLRNVNVRWGSFELGSLQEMRFSDEELAAFSIEDGDLLVCEGGEPGRCAVWRHGKTNIKYQKALLRLRPYSGVQAQFIAYYLEQLALSGELAEYFTGTTIKHLTHASLSRVPIPVPPLPEQRRIVAKLDSLRARSSRARLELARIPALIERYKRAILHTVFEEIFHCHHTENLIDMVESERGIPYGIIQTGAHDPNGVPTIRAGDIKKNVVDAGNLKRVAPNIEEEYRRTRLRGGEVVISIRGTVGNSAVIPKTLTGGNISREVALIPVKEGVVAEYISHYLASPQAQEYIGAQIKGVAQTGINLRDLRQLKVPCPPTEVQAETARRIQNAHAWLSSVASEHARAAHLLPKLDQAILAKAFCGELVPQDPNDEPASVLLERIRKEREAQPTKPRRGRKASA